MLVGWLSLSLPIFAQYHFRTIDSRSGLPDNYVSAVLKDKDGFMWIATPNGLSRYDGFSHRLYEIRKEDGSLEPNIRRLEEDQTGQMWITTYDDSIFLYDRMLDQITPTATSLLKQKGIPTGKHMKVFVDANKNLWCIDGKKISRSQTWRHQIWHHQYSFRRRQMWWSWVIVSSLPKRKIINWSSEKKQLSTHTSRLFQGSIHLDKRVYRPFFLQYNCLVDFIPISVTVTVVTVLFLQLSFLIFLIFLIPVRLPYKKV